MPPLDYKKQARRLYLPSAVPAVVDVPEMQFFMVDGTGDPNAPDGEYSHALELLYTLSYAVRMGGKKELSRLRIIWNTSSFPWKGSGGIRGKTLPQIKIRSAGLP